MNKNMENLVGKYIFLNQGNIVNPNYIKVKFISYSKVFDSYIINTDYNILVSEIYAVTSSEKDANTISLMITEMNSELEYLKKSYEQLERGLKTEMNYSLSLYGALVPKNHFS